MNVLPRFLQFMPPINHPKAKEIARRSGWAYLKVIISNCHNKLKNFRSMASKSEKKLDQTLTDEEYVLSTRLYWIGSNKRNQKFAPAVGL